MLRILLIIVITYLVIRIALRLLLTESPSQRRYRVRNGYGAPYRNDRRRGNRESHGSAHSPFGDIEDAEFEELPNDPADKEKS